MRLAWLTLLALVIPASGETFRGSVISADRAAGTLRIRSETGVESMVRAGAGDLEIGWVGRPVRGELLTSDGQARLERIFPEDSEASAEAKAVAAALRRDTVERGRLVARAEGDYAPPFALWDQGGRFVRSGDLRGKPCVVNFVFTRCKAAEMCPAATASMVALTKALRAADLAGRVTLVTVTFDPAHDSPGVLRTYAAGWGADPTHHLFLTGDREMIRDLMRQYGILVLEQDGTLVHNAATYIISPDGRIVARHPGARFDAEELLPLLRGQLAPR